MDVTGERIRAFRPRAHHLDAKLPPGALAAAARAAAKLAARRV